MSGSRGNDESKNDSSGYDIESGLPVSSSSSQASSALQKVWKTVNAKNIVQIISMAANSAANIMLGNANPYINLLIGGSGMALGYFADVQNVNERFNQLKTTYLFLDEDPKKIGKVKAPSYAGLFMGMSCLTLYVVAGFYAPVGAMIPEMVQNGLIVGATVLPTVGRKRTMQLIHRGMDEINKNIKGSLDSESKRQEFKNKIDAICNTLQDDKPATEADKANMGNQKDILKTVDELVKAYVAMSTAEFEATRAESNDIEQKQLPILYQTKALTLAHQEKVKAAISEQHKALDAVSTQIQELEQKLYRTTNAMTEKRRAGNDADFLALQTQLTVFVTDKALLEKNKEHLEIQLANNQSSVSDCTDKLAAADQEIAQLENKMRELNELCQAINHGIESFNIGLHEKIAQLSAIIKEGSAGLENNRLHIRVEGDVISDTDTNQSDQLDYVAMGADTDSDSASVASTPSLGAATPSSDMSFSPGLAPLHTSISIDSFQISSPKNGSWSAGSPRLYTLSTPKASDEEVELDSKLHVSLQLV